MAASDRLTRAELETVLHRALAAESRSEEATFTKDDLLAVAREIGLSQERVELAYREQLEGRHEGKALARLRPHDTRISLSAEPARFELQLPALGLRGRHLPAVLFAVTWMGFLLLWTGAAVSHGAGLAAAFSTPFWLVGASVLTTAARDSMQRIRLILDESGRGRLHRQFERPIELDLAQLRVRLRRGKRSRPSSGYLELEHGTKSYRLLEGWSAAERRWVARELRRWLRSRTPRA